MRNGLFALLAVCALATGCTTAVDGRAVAGDETEIAVDEESEDVDASECTEVDAPLTDIEPSAGADPSEPRLRIPQPDGWDRFSELDSELIRFAMRNVDLGTATYAPTAVVTVETIPEAIEPESYFEQSRDALAQAFGDPNITYEDGTICGLPAQTINYVLPKQNEAMPGPVPATALAVVMVDEESDTTYAAVLTTQTPTPDNPEYVDDAEQIHSGFQVLPPEAGG